MSLSDSPEGRANIQDSWDAQDTLRAIAYHARWILICAVLVTGVILWWAWKALL